MAGLVPAIHVFLFVMAGLVPAIHAFPHCSTDVDARDKPAHDA
jgi:hypothetical protein